MALELSRQLNQQELLLNLSPYDILRAGIEAQRLEVIPISNILAEEGLIDPYHARELGESMKQKRGQISPVTVRARFDGMNVVYDIIDGFHRTEAGRMNGNQEIDANVLYGCSDQELYDLRILAASSVESVQFARMALWITSAFALTPWAKKGLTVVNAFNMAYMDSKNTYLPGFDMGEVSDIKAWVKDKCTVWQRPMGSVRLDLQLAEISDPTLVRSVRKASGGYETVTTITETKLIMVARAFPGEKGFYIQRAIMNFAIDNRANKTVLEALISAGNSINPAMSEEEITKLLKKAYDDIPDSEKIYQRPGKKAKDKLTEDIKPTGESSGVVMIEDEPTMEEIKAIEDGLGEDEVILGSRMDLAEEEENPKRSRNVPILQARIKELERELETARTAVNANGNIPWWEDPQYDLTRIEKICISRGFYGVEDPTELAKDLRLTLPQLYVQMRRGFDKRKKILADNQIQ